VKLTALAERAHRHEDTGIYVRAFGPDGKPGSFDIAELDRQSVLDWLRTRPELAERTVLLLLGHDLST